MPNAWQPIETAPMDGKEILLWAEGMRRCFVGAWIEAGWGHDGWYARGTVGFDKLHSVITHWQPLPAPPEEK